MTLTFRCTESDYASARYVWSLRHLWTLFNQAPELGAAVGAVLLSIFVLAVSSHQDHRPDWQGAYYLIAGGLLFCAIPALLGLRWRIHREFKQKFPAAWDASATVDENGINLPARGSGKEHLWAGFTRIYESRRVVVMETGGKDFIFLPKSAMSGAQLQEFKRLAMAGTLDCPVRIATV